MTQIQEIYRSALAPQFPVPILYEDNHLLFAVKPPGLLSQEDHTGRPDILNLLKDYLVTKYHKPGQAWLGLVHRLDQPVAGVMVFAKTSKAASRMSDCFRRQAVEKAYLAIVHGQPNHRQGELVDHLSTTKKNGRYRVDPKGKIARLQYEMLAFQPERQLTLVKILLQTGRQHQIRVQFASRGCPLLGDRRYGKQGSLDQTCPGPALLAYRLAFVHPVKKTPLAVQMELPETFPWSIFQDQKNQL